MEPVLVNPPPAIENRPPTIVTGDATLIPVMVAGEAALISVDCGTLVCGAKLNGFGTAFGMNAVVVTEKVAATPPTLTVAEVVVPAAAADCTRTARV